MFCQDYQATYSFKCSFHCNKLSGKGVVRAENGFNLLISNGNMDDVTKIVELLEISGLLIDGATETVEC